MRETKTVSRSWAIKRIESVNYMIIQRDWYGLEKDSYEETPISFSNIPQHVSNSGITTWSNTMLEEVLDKPYYREKYSYNYMIGE